jgi:chromosome segregation ATPase
MPDPKSKLDETLAEFLDQQSQDKRMGYTIAGLHTQMHEFLRVQARNEREIAGLKENHNELVERHEDLEKRVDAHREAIVGVKRVLKKRHTDPEDSEFDAQMDTGSFDLATIKRKVDEQEKKREESERVKADNATWFKRHMITIGFSAIGAVFLALIVLVIQLAVTGAKQQLMVPTTTAKPEK